MGFIKEFVFIGSRENRFLDWENYKIHIIRKITLVIKYTFSKETGSWEPRWTLVTTAQIDSIFIRALAKDTKERPIRELLKRKSGDFQPRCRHRQTHCVSSHNQKKDNDNS